MSESDSDVTYCSQENVIVQSIPLEPIFSIPSSSHVKKFDKTFLTKVRNDIWMHMRKKAFMNKRKASEYLKILNDSVCSQQPEYFAVLKSINLLKKIIASLDYFEEITRSNSKVLERSMSNLSSGFNVAGDIAALKNVTNPVQYENVVQQLPFDLSVNFTSSNCTSFPESMLSNRNFVNHTDSGISDSFQNDKIPALKKLKTVVGSVNKYSNTDPEEVKRKKDIPIVESGINDEVPEDHEQLVNNIQIADEHPGDLNTGTEDIACDEEDEEDFEDMNSLTKMSNLLEEKIQQFQANFTREVEEIETTKMQVMTAGITKPKYTNPFFFCESEQPEDAEDEDTAQPELDLKSLALFYEREYNKLCSNDDDEELV